MPERYLPGVPCWVDLVTPDPEGAARFYGGVLGWQVDGGIARLAGSTVAGIVRGEPAVWRTHVAVADPARDGEVLTDPAGARLWLRSGPGAEHVNGPGGWNWSNLESPDLDAALAFYAAELGWVARPVEFAPEARMLCRPGYGDLLAELDPELRERHGQPGIPEGFSDAVAWAGPGPVARWTVTFSVDDAVAAAERATALGGEVLAGPRDEGPTTVADLRDPQGAELTVSCYTPEGSA